MLNLNEKRETANVKAILIGLFLIILIATITLIKSNSDKNNLSENKKELPRVEAIDLEKVGKITSEELAKKIQTNSNSTLIDLRDENEYKFEHIIDSINIPLSRIGSFPDTLTKNNEYILIEELEEATVINNVASILLDRGYEKILYLEGGFNSWKNKFNPTISDGDQNSFTDQAKVTYISSDDLKKRIEVEKNIIIIDVRKNTEFNAGHLAGAVNIFLDDLERKRKELPLGKLIVLYDNNNLGAFKGATRLFDLGLSNTLALSDGLDAWKKKGYAIEK